MAILYYHFDSGLILDSNLFVQKLKLLIMQEEQLWVEDAVFGFLIAQLNPETQTLQITSQEIEQLDESIDQREVNLPNKGKVDPLGKNGVSDLLLLQELNEPNYLHTVRVRYYKKQIYTQVGNPIMIALNPYQTLPQYYSFDMIKKYKIQMRELRSYLNHSILSIGKDLLQDKIRGVEPHLYKVAQLSLDQLFEQTEKQSRMCSMIITGESGSGKTESTKIILKYLAQESESGLFNTFKNKASLEEQIFASNPMLEAFGNAKTARNDNSSRFGKFIHIYFEPRSKKIVSGKVDNYILEKSRVVKLSKCERNYHIFYQLIAAQLPELYLQDWSNYCYLKDGDGMLQNEEENYFETQECLRKMGFSQEDQLGIFKVVAGILHLGNVAIQEDNFQSFLIQNDELKWTCDLLGLKIDDLIQIVCKVESKVGSQVIMKDNSMQQAIVARDTLAKHIYNKLFNWLIFKVNSQLHQNSQRNNTKEKLFMMGILDIFGFEIFMDEKGVHTNSFEQLNINFTNEKLQEHFNTHMLETEQTEYNAEGIKWQHIQFPDNKGIIDIIENPKLSIYKLLIDQCITIRGSDKEFLNSIKNLKQDFLIVRDTIQTAELDPRIDRKAHRLATMDWFGIKHFAGNVIYNIEGFVEKNKDSINQKVHVVLPQSQNAIIREIQKQHQFEAQNMGQSNVLTFFQNQLKELLGILHKSVPKYIRCIKPNNSKAAFEFDAQEVRRQMRCAGLLEAIQIRKAGYEIRVFHDEFIKKYRFLVKGKPNKINQFLNSLCDNPTIKTRIIQEIKDLSLQIGKSKMYFKENLRDFLDQQLIEYKSKFIVMIQKCARRYIFRKRVKTYMKTISKKLRKIAKNMKIFLLRKRIERRIAQKKVMRRAFELISKYRLGLQRVKAYNQIKSYSDWKLQEQRKIDKMKEELQKQFQIDHKPQPESENQNTQQLSAQGASRVGSTLNQSRTTQQGAPGASNLLLMQQIKEGEKKLKQEQQRRRELEEEVENLTKKLEDTEGLLAEYQMQRGTLNNQAQMEEIMHLTRLTQENADFQVQVERLKLEKNMIEQELNKTNLELEEKIQENEQITVEFLQLKSSLDELELKKEEEIKKIKREFQQQADQARSSQQLNNRTSQLQAELEKERKARMELEVELKKQKELRDIQRQQQQLDFEVVIDHSKCEKQIKQLEGQLASKESMIQMLNKKIEQMDNRSPVYQQPQMSQAGGSLQPGGRAGLDEELKKKEQQLAQNKKLVSVMNNLVKIKILEINAYTKHFNVTEQQRQIIYKDIQQVMEKEKMLMKQFEDLMQQYKASIVDVSLQQN